jgi:hypothetical protein
MREGNYFTIRVYSHIEKSMRPFSVPVNGIR